MTRKFTTILSLSLSSCLLWAAPTQKNLLVITVDDMSADSVGAFGCPLPDTTPRMDRLAKESLVFRHAHVQVGNCYPSRNVMFSGLYPHNNGAEGFYKVVNDYPTLTDLLNDAGYFTAIRGKASHTTPHYPYAAWGKDLSNDTNGSKPHIKDVPSYGASVTAGIAAARKANKPFYLNVNISDPHKPFWKPNDKYPASKVFKAKDVPIPGFLFDHQEVRAELALYYTSVRRADDAVGSILDALDQSGAADDTIVVFLSDHGMPFPFAKTALWHHSTHTPLMVRAPGITKAGSENTQHLVSSVDFVPTFLDLLGLPHPKKQDGASFAALIRGETAPGFDAVFKVYNENSGGIRNPMRAVQTKEFLYLWSPWSDGKLKFRTATTGTASYRTLRKLAPFDPTLSQRLALFDFGVPHALYHVTTDPNCLHNLAEDPAHAADLSSMQRRLQEFMTASDDHALTAFKNRNDPQSGPSYTAKKQAESDTRRAARRKGKAKGAKKK